MLFRSVTGTYPALDASAVTGLTSANLTGTFGALNASAVTGLTSANLTGTLPAISGAALTNVPSAFTESASDPLITTNPAGGLGTVWVNTTSGEMYACTDATTDANVWTNVGTGSGDVIPYSYAGSIAGYSMGGGNNHIDKYTFASDGDAEASGILLTSNNSYHGTQSVQSSTAGYTMGGYGAPYLSRIDKFLFANSSGSASAGVGSITGTANGVAGCNDITHGYRVAGWTGGGTGFNIIERFPFATDGACDDVGDLGKSGHGCSSSSTETHGYITGAQASPNTAVQKFAFASSGSSTDAPQTLINYRDYAGSATNTTHGFVMGGNRTTVRIDVESYAFASSAAMSDIGDLHHTVHSCSSSSSQTHGYCAGDAVDNSKRIHKIQLSSSATGTSVGNLHTGVGTSTGCFQ